MYARKNNKMKGSWPQSSERVWFLVVLSFLTVMNIGFSRFSTFPKEAVEAAPATNQAVLVDSGQSRNQKPWRRSEQQQQDEGFLAANLRTGLVSGNGSKGDKDGDDFALADHESYGFFQDIPSREWRLKQEISAQTPHHLDAQFDKVARFFWRPKSWYQNNWEPDFSCSFERFVGPIRDGHKWVCDPHRLAADPNKPCLIYSFGSNGNTDFEGGIHAIAPHCDIHIFDPGSFGYRVKRNLPNATYHQYGLKPSYSTDLSLLESKEGLPPGQFKTFTEIIKELGHQDRTVDIFKIDIEKGEWTTFRDWLNSGVNLRQILVEVHMSPPIANDFFATLHQAGYVMFHKEPNSQFASGNCVEFAFLKLRPSFFEASWEHQRVEHSKEALQHAADNQLEYEENHQKKDFDYGREMKATGIV